MKINLQTLTALSLMMSYSSGIQCSSPSEDRTANPSDLTSSIENANAYFYKPSTQKFFGFAEFLFWKPVTDPIDWATLRNNVSVNANNKPSSQTCQDEQLSFSYAPGFRIGAGYQFKEGAFDKNSRPLQIEASYERIATKTSSSAKATEASEQVNPIVPTILTTKPSYGHSKVDLDYNRADLKIAWPLWANDSVIFRLQAGTTFAAFNSKWVTKFQDRSNNSSDSRLKWNWWGAGLLGSGDVDIELGKGFGLFANTSFAFLFGQMDTSEKYKTMNADGSSASPLSATRHYYSFQPVLEFGLGIDYKHWYNSILLYASAGWEINYWFDMNQYGRIYSRSSDLLSRVPDPQNYFLETTPKSLSFEGLTARLGVAF